jgi:hypothetical protein
LRLVVPWWIISARGLRNEFVGPRAVAFGRVAVDPDSDERPVVAYLFGGSFLTLWITYAGVLSISSTIIGLLGSHTAPFSLTEQHPYLDQVIRTLSQGLLVTGVAVTAYLMHRRRGIELVQSESDPSSPSRRVMKGYVAAVRFLSTVIVILGVLAFAYSFLQLIAPGVFQASGSRADTWITLLQTAVLLVVTGFVFRTHQALLPEEHRLFNGMRRHPQPATEE